MEKTKLIKIFLNRGNVFAVVGVSRNPGKYGHKVYRDLREGGYKVYPVNPGEEEVLGDKCYPSLKDLPEKPDVVDIVVNPEVTEKVVKECRKLGVRKVWMQPGSESNRAIEFCRQAGIEVLHGVCIMIERLNQ